MRIDLQHFGIHGTWGGSAATICFGLVLWYGVACFQAGELLHGGSLPALVCGVTAGSIILFEMLLAPRKWLRGWRLFPTKHWLAAHLWFGLASWPLAVVHSGFHLGGGLPTTFIVVFSLTIFSGMYGWILQNIIPKMLLKQVRHETIYSQIDFVSKRNFADAESMLIRNFGLPTDYAQDDNATLHFEDQGSHSRHSSAVVVGALRGANKVRGNSFQTAGNKANAAQLAGTQQAATLAAPQDAERLWHALLVLKSFLLQGKRSGNEFARASNAVRYFSNLRKACDPSSGPIIDALEEFCIQRHEFDVQQRLHHWLHSWLPVHIGLSVAVTVLLFVHVITAIRYW